MKRGFWEGRSVYFLFSGTKVTPHAAFVKGRFTLRVKKSPVLASLVRYFFTLRP